MDLYVYALSRTAFWGLRQRSLHRFHSAALAAKQTELSALPRRSLMRLCGVPWAVPNTQETLLKKRPIT
jgi:hypothetical protein